MARPRSDIQPRIVHAARAEFLARGVDAATLRAIARRARTTIGMIYYYFPSKDDLFMAVIEEVYAGFLDDLAAAVAGCDDTRSRIRALMGRIGSAHTEEREVLFLVVREVLTAPDRRDRILARFLRDHIGLMLGVVADGQRRGEVDPALPVPVVAVVTGAVGAFPQLAAQGFSALGLPTGTALADLLVDVLFRGIAPPSEPDSHPRRKER
jgi:AcrR family transcriptional regulator